MNQRLPAPLSDERLDVWADKETQPQSLWRKLENTHENIHRSQDLQYVSLAYSTWTKPCNNKSCYHPHCS